MSEVPLFATWRALLLQEMLEVGDMHRPYRGTSLIRDTPPVGPYRKPVPRGLW